MGNCCCGGGGEPPIRGACCFLIPPTFEEFGCEDNVTANDCAAKIGGRFFPDQTCINIDCEEDPPSSVKCNFDTLECGVNPPPPWEWISNCAVCTSTTSSTTTTATTTTESPECDCECLTQDCCSNPACGSLPVIDCTVCPGREPCYWDCNICACANGGDTSVCGPCEGACCETCTDGLGNVISQTCTDGVSHTSCNESAGSSGCTYTFVYGASCDDINCETVTTTSYTTTTTTTTENPCSNGLPCSAGDSCPEGYNCSEILCCCDGVPTRVVGQPGCCVSCPEGCEPPELGVPCTSTTTTFGPTTETSTSTTTSSPTVPCPCEYLDCGCPTATDTKPECAAGQYFDCEQCQCVEDDGGGGPDDPEPPPIIISEAIAASSCSDSVCQYEWMYPPGSWVQTASYCSEGCTCPDPPNYPAAQGVTVELDCQGEDTTTSTTTTAAPTTTTTGSPCSQSNCTYQWTVSQGWQQLSNNCADGCECSGPPSSAPSSDGYTEDVACQDIATTTTTTTTSSTTSSTTTTLDPAIDGTDDTTTTTTTGTPTTTTGTTTTTTGTTTTTTASPGGGGVGVGGGY